MESQIFTPSFRDSSGDGVGDFKGIAEKLEEIRKIGIQNVWATPVITTDKVATCISFFFFVRPTIFTSKKKLKALLVVILNTFRRRLAASCFSGRL